MSFKIFAAALLACVVAFVGSCRQPVAEGPETFPVRGKVVFTKGGTAKDLSDHSIFVQFQSAEQPAVVASGEIMEDGSFAMSTQAGATGKPGAIAGKHRVRLNADESGARFVAPRFLNYETSGLQVIVPNEGVLEIKVSR